MTDLAPSPSQSKVTATHLERLAVIYVRQSSAKQVRDHQESQFNQRSLVERARALGWHAERIRLLDGDLGQSGSSLEGRDDFKALTAETALGRVGIIFGWEVSRLARNNAHWYQLLDLAAVFGTLIADNEGLYDPGLYNDRLLLGLKGTMSEAELHMLKARLNAGRLSKVRRGEYVQHLPSGLLRQSDGSVVKDPDRQVCDTIALVLAKFRELGSCHKVLRFLKGQGILLPRHQTSGFHAGQLLWRRPSADAVYQIVRNPVYAGAFVYGRTKTDPRRQVAGHPSSGRVHRPLEEWLIRQDAYPAYISWEEYLANRARLQDNASRQAELLGRGGARQGAALLQGLATCGHCGHLMRAVYKPGVRYVCYGLSKQFGERSCASLDGPSVEQTVVEAFFAAIQPAELDALEALLESQREQHRALERYHEQQVQRARYEAHLARRRYEAVDPDHRLVAGELERRWEEALLAQRQAEEAAERSRQEPELVGLDGKLRQQLEHIAQALPELWRSGRLGNEHKKLLLRSLIARVILTRPLPDRVEVKIVWVSGHFTLLALQPPVWRRRDVSGYASMVERVRQLWGEGQSDSQIALQLTQEGFHSARSRAVTTDCVRDIRLEHRWLQTLERSRKADTLDGYLTVAGLAKRLGVRRGWLYRQLERGHVDPRYFSRDPQSGVYLIADDAEFIAALRQSAACPRT